MSGSTSPAPPRASLLGLPAELRLHIYELLSSIDPPCWRVTGTADWQEHVTTARTGFFNLAAMCSLTRHEIKPLLATDVCRPFVELINFTKEDADLWIELYASRLSQMCCITIQLWAGCGSEYLRDMEGGHYLTCAAQKKNKKTNDHMRCDEQCDYGYGYKWKKANIFPMKRSFGLCKRLVHIDINSIEHRGRCRHERGRQLRYCYGLTVADWDACEIERNRINRWDGEDDECANPYLGDLCRDMQEMEKTGLKVEWLGRVFANMTNNYSWPKRALEQEWAGFVETGYPEKFAAEHGIKDEPVWWS